MADKGPIRYVPTRNGDTGLVLPIVEANSQTFVKGDLVFAAAGLLTICGADPAVILGIALESGTNVTSGNQHIPVQIIRPSDLFIMNFIDAKTFVAADGAPADFEIVRTSAGIWEVDSTTAANTARVMVHASAEFDSIASIPSVTGGIPFGRSSTGRLAATAGGPVYVRFLQVSGTTVNILQFGMSGT